jgi:DNA-binding beta-propeller fold protein YncE
VDPTGRFVYVANGGGFNMFVYKINQSTGGLTVVGSPVPVGASLTAVAVDPSGHFVYVANTSGSISTFTINQSSGRLTGVGIPVPAGTTPLSIAITALIQ